MKKILSASVLILSTIGLGACQTPEDVTQRPEAVTQIQDPQRQATKIKINKKIEVDNIFCARNYQGTVSRATKSYLPAEFNNLEEKRLTNDFRTQKRNKSWSQALAYEDPVTGSFVGVLDRNFIPGGSKVTSFWQRNHIAVNGYWLFVEKLGAFGGDPVATFIPFEADILWIPEGEDNFLIVKGCNGQFVVTKEIAKALANADSSQNAYIRFTTEKTGSVHLSQVGQKTVAAWKTVYANWKPAKKI